MCGNTTTDRGIVRDAAVSRWEGGDDWMNTRYRLLTKDDTDKFITDIMKEVNLNTGHRKKTKEISIKEKNKDFTVRRLDIARVDTRKATI